MAVNHQQEVVNELTALIRKGNAHASFEDAVEGIDLNVLTTVPDKLPYSIWQLAEHIRIAQWDILEFCKGPGHQSPKWPDEYWPAHEETISKERWQSTLDSISKDREEFLKLLKQEGRDLHQPFEYGDGQTLFREALLIADHIAYHTGEIIVIRRLLGNWKS